jgi:hypothetical protein
MYIYICIHYTLYVHACIVFPSNPPGRLSHPGMMRSQRRMGSCPARRTLFTWKAAMGCVRTHHGHVDGMGTVLTFPSQTCSDDGWWPRRDFFTLWEEGVRWVILCKLRSQMSQSVLCQRKLGSNLPSYGQIKLWYLNHKTIHSWRVVWYITSQNNTFMKGGVIPYITKQYIHEGWCRYLDLKYFTSQHNTSMQGGVGTYGSVDLGKWWWRGILQRVVVHVCVVLCAFWIARFWKLWLRNAL